MTPSKKVVREIKQQRFFSKFWTSVGYITLFSVLGTTLYLSAEYKKMQYTVIHPQVQTLAEYQKSPYLKLSFNDHF